MEHATERSVRQGRRFQFIITTNGTLLDERRLDYLDAHGFFVGLSLDGCRAAHEAAWWLMERRIGARIIAVIDPVNVDHLAESFDVLLAFGARSLSMNLNREAGCDEAARDRFVTALRALGERHIAAHRRGALIDAKDTLAPDCEACALQLRCMRWCGCVNHAMTGRVGEVDGLLCWFEQRIIEEAARCAGVLFADQVSGFIRRFYVPRLRAPVAG